LYAAQGSPQFDAEIAEKGHLWMETISARQAIHAYPVSARVLGAVQ